MTTTFERVKKVILSLDYEETVPDSIRPESTLEKLGLSEGIFGLSEFFFELEEEFKKDNLGFEFPDGANPETVQQVVAVVDQELARVGVGS